MKTKILLIAAATMSIIAGAGISFATAADDENRNDQTYRDQDNQNSDQNMSDQGYDRHWFSSTGYGPNDDQADQTRSLNREQLENRGHVDQRRGRGDDDEDIQGPSDDDSAADDNDDDDRDDNGAPPSDDR